MSAVKHTDAFTGLSTILLLSKLENLSNEFMLPLVLFIIIIALNKHENEGLSLSSLYLKKHLKHIFALQFFTNC